GPDGRPLPGFAKKNCRPVRVNSTRHKIDWTGSADLARLRGKPVSLRFDAVNSRLYSFWVTPDPSGASHGYVAAGGPGFTGPTEPIGAVQLKSRPLANPTEPRQ